MDFRSRHNITFHPNNLVMRPVVVMIIDDNFPVLHLYQTLLATESYQVKTLPSLDSYLEWEDQSLNVTAGGGVFVVAHSSNPREEGDVDPIFFAALTKTWARTGVGLNWALDTGRGGGFEGTTTTQTVGLVADHTPHPNLALFLNVNFEDSSPKNEATGLEIDEQRYLVSPGVSYNFLRYFNLSGSYTYSRIEGDEGFVGSKFQEFTASLSITLRQDLPHFSVDYSHIENDSEVDLDDFDRDVLLFSVNYSLPFGL